jgi:hypothetical protein
VGIPRPKLLDLSQDFIDAVLLKTRLGPVQSPRGVAPAAAQVTPEKPHKNLFDAGVFAFALDGVEDF